MSDLTTATGTKVVIRPLHVLVPLIRSELEQAEQASKRATMPYYQSVGQKLLEAKGQLSHGEFTPWLKRTFGISPSTAQQYMKLAVTTRDMQNEEITSFKSMNDFHRQTGDSKYRDVTTRRGWHEPVKDVLNKVDVNFLNARKNVLAEEEERAAEHTLALQLIDIGYKALATKLHPDKGGSRNAMARLNRIRARLKQYA